MARANLLAASVLVSPNEIIFANIGSKLAVIFEPLSIPTSQRTKGSSVGSKAIIFPVTGRKSFPGSSAYSLTSIDEP